MPLSGDVGQNLHELKHHGTKKRSRAQMIAIAIAAARRAGKYSMTSAFIRAIRLSRGSPLRFVDEENPAFTPHRSPQVDPYVPHRIMGAPAHHAGIGADDPYRCPDCAHLWPQRSQGYVRAPNGHELCHACASNLPYRCPSCDDEHPTHRDTFEFDGEGNAVCTNCVDDAPYLCPACDTLHRTRNDGHVVQADGRNACTDCAALCPACEEYHDTDDFVEATSTSSDSNARRVRNSNRYVANICESCGDGGADYFRCGDCREYFHNDLSGGRNTHDDEICRDCGSSYFYCDRCDTTFHNDDYGDDGMCRSCSEESEQEEEPPSQESYGRSSGLIHGYSYKPERWIAHGDQRHAHYGAELETVLKEGDFASAAEQTLDMLNQRSGVESFAFLKKDGSLKGGVGQFEIVTHPATLDEHRKRWEEFLANKPRALVSHEAPCEAGLHVHVGRDKLTELQIWKMYAFVNAPQNADFVTAIARRGPNRWAQRFPDKGPGWVKESKSHDDRYEALNLEPDHTIEFRLFKGTLNRQSFFRSLEFVDAMVAFSAVGQRTVADAKRLDEFLGFVVAHKKRWPILAEFCHRFDLTRRGIGMEAARQQDKRGLAQSLMSAQLQRSGA